MSSLPKRFALILVGLPAWGCDVAERPAPAGTPADAAEDVAAQLATGPVALEGSGPWTAASTRGSRVTLAVAPVPITAGTLRLDISVTGDRDGPGPLSVDLVSPTMPGHGIVRSAVTSNDGTGTASIEIPMEGRWALYVNLDDGGDSAGFVFDALPGGGMAHPRHAP